MDQSNNKGNDYLILILIFLFIAYWSHLQNETCPIYVSQSISELTDMIKRTEMYSINGTLLKLEGYARYSDYYCVWTANMTNSQIADIDEHERCHLLVSNDYNHFCVNPFSISN